MPEKKFAEQMKRIQAATDAAGLDDEGMARRVAIRPESLRKVRKGYQPASEQLITAIERASAEISAQPLTGTPREKLRAALRRRGLSIPQLAKLTKRRDPRAGGRRGAKAIAAAEREVSDRAAERHSPASRKIISHRREHIPTNGNRLRSLKWRRWAHRWRHAAAIISRPPLRPRAGVVTRCPAVAGFCFHLSG